MELSDGVVADRTERGRAGEYDIVSGDVVEERRGMSVQEVIEQTGAAIQRSAGGGDARERVGSSIQQLSDEHGKVDAQEVPVVVGCKPGAYALDHKTQ
jgi:hypothetical protein